MNRVFLVSFFLIGFGAFIIVEPSDAFDPSGPKEWICGVEGNVYSDSTQEPLCGFANMTVSPTGPTETGHFYGRVLQGNLMVPERIEFETDNCVLLYPGMPNRTVELKLPLKDNVATLQPGGFHIERFVVSWSNGPGPTVEASQPSGWGGQIPTGLGKLMLNKVPTKLVSNGQICQRQDSMQEATDSTDGILNVGTINVITPSANTTNPTNTTPTATRNSNP